MKERQRDRRAVDAGGGGEPVRLGGGAPTGPEWVELVVIVAALAACVVGGALHAARALGWG